MNFLMLRSNNSQPSVKETEVDVNYVTRTPSTLEGLIAEDPFPERTSSESRHSENDEFGNENGTEALSSGKNNQVDCHIDVTEDDGSIVIPCKEVPDNWTEASDIIALRSVDRSFVFPGEQIHILACLSAYKQDTEIITPFKVAAVMNKTGIGKSPRIQNGNVEGEEILDPETTVATSGDHGNELVKTDLHRDVSTGESLLRMEDHKRQTEQLLRRFENSHFFVRIAESNEPLWSRRIVEETYLESSVASDEQLAGDFSETATTTKRKNHVSALIDRGKLDPHTSGGLARGAAKCCSLSNGDIVVLLQVNVGTHFLRDPTLEILQFEKHQDRNLSIKNQDIHNSLNQDPYGELLKWLLPAKNSIPPPARLSPAPTLSSSSSIRSASVSGKPAVPASSSSQLFSFGHFRSYSMSSIPPNATPPAATPPAATPPAATLPVSVSTPEIKPTPDPEDWNQFSIKKFVGSGKCGNEELFSFRGVPLQQERFSVRCGLEGIFTPGRRWKRKIELIHPVEVHSFSVDCNTDDLLCVHVKNVTPAHAPDIVMFIDSITIIFEEASNGGPPLFLPIACIESGNNYSLPNLELRKGEEHSFILKPATAMWKHGKGQIDGNPRVSRVSAGSPASSWSDSNYGVKNNGSPADQFAVLVSCRCNYTESKLFFKQPTSWRPRISRDLVISVASEMSQQALGSDGTQLPVQVLTLQASNMTSDDLTLTVLAPASFTFPPSVVSLSNSPVSPFSASTELTSDTRAAVAHGKDLASLKYGNKVEDYPQSTSLTEQTLPMSDCVPNSDMGCSHLWLQSRVPLGCVPSQSTATVKLEVLPLTDGIITLDSLQIEVRETGLTYVPEQSLKINATSSIATGIL